jgi:two-component system, NarL family, response regulator DegU
MSVPEATNRLRVMLVDDHPMFRRGLQLEISASEGLEVVCEASDGAQAIAGFEFHRPDLVVLDVHLPDMTGLDVARRILQISPGARIAIVTMLRDEEAFNVALGIGVLGYVLKECAADEIMDCVRTVARGEPYVSAQLSGYLLRRRAGQEAVKAGSIPLDRLTTAERRVLRLLARTLTSKEIALELGVSPRTIDAHRANIGDKLGLRGSHSLLRFAIANRGALENLP